MSITVFQRAICRLIAANRIASGESYVAGGVALNTLIDSPRQSTDIDLFHDAQEAVAAAWLADNTLLERAGYQVNVRRQLPVFVEALVAKGQEEVLIQWAQDSAYRFFPLQEHADFGLTLHPFDLATNKVLALVGRLEVRDWIDVIACHESIQNLGYLAWAAAGKDPGFSPPFILEEAARSARYTQIEIDAMSFESSPPSAVKLSQRWRIILNEAREMVDSLPVREVGTCVLNRSGELLQAPPADLRALLESGAVRFHSGCIRGAYPQILSTQTRHD